jgi:hypothetical protein
MYLPKGKQAAQAQGEDGGQVPRDEPAWHLVLQRPDALRMQHSERRTWDPYFKNVVDDWIFKASNDERHGSSARAYRSRGSETLKGEPGERSESIVYEAPAYGVVLIDAPPSRACTQVLSQLVPTVFYGDIDARFCRILVQRTVGLPLAQMLRELQSICQFQSRLSSMMMVVIIDGANLIDDDAARTATAIKRLLDQEVDVVCRVDNRFKGVRKLIEQLSIQNIPTTMTNVRELRQGRRPPLLFREKIPLVLVDSPTALPVQQDVASDFTVGKEPTRAAAVDCSVQSSGRDNGADEKGAAALKPSNVDAECPDTLSIRNYLGGVPTYSDPVRRPRLGKTKARRVADDDTDEDKHRLD